MKSVKTRDGFDLFNFHSDVNVQYRIYNGDFIFTWL